MDRKILFTDMDGTLLNDKKEISEKVYRALKELHDRGHILVFATGRPVGGVLATAEPLGIVFPGSYIIAYNGSLAYSIDDRKAVIEHTVSLDDVRIIMDEGHSLGIHVQTYEDDKIIAEDMDEELILYKKNIHIPHVIVPDITSYLKKEPYKLLSIKMNNHSLLEELRERVLSKVGDRITAAYSNDNFLEFYPVSSGKGNTLADLCKYLGIPVANSAAVGDERNDISMIKAAGLGCAVRNAVPEVKEAAKLVTQNDNNNDGILELIEAFF